MRSCAADCRIAFSYGICYNGSMVNKVGGNDYYDYSKLKMPDAADKTGTGEKFSLNYQRAQEETTEQDKKDESGESEGIKKTGSRNIMQGGVRLELSQNSRPVSGTERRRPDSSQDFQQSLIDTVRSWMRILVQSLKDIVYKIWNDPVQQEDTAAGPEPAQDAAAPERLTEEYLAWNDPEHTHSAEETVSYPRQRAADRDKEIRQYLRSGNLEQVISLVTDNGNKTMAKNSTLLTYYDRHGRLTPLSASDQERILHGDKNVRKL